jgi:Inner membrane protein YgaP-like, transmembrane domain
VFTRNVAGVDRAARLAIGIVLLPVALLLLGGPGGGIFGIAATAVGLIGLLSGVTGFCPTYVLLGWSTARERQAAPGGAR